MPSPYALCVQIPVAAVLAFAVGAVLVDVMRRLAGKHARYVVVNENSIGEYNQQK